VIRSLRCRRLRVEGTTDRTRRPRSRRLADRV